MGKGALCGARSMPSHPPPHLCCTAGTPGMKRAFRLTEDHKPHPQVRGERRGGERERGKCV